MGAVHVKKMIISNFGPVSHLALDLNNNLNVIIGAQASGKSTIGKTIYFCRKIKDYLVDYLTDADSFNHHPNEYYLNFLKYIRKQFIACFGTTKHMNKFYIEFFYSVENNKKVNIVLGDDGFVNINFEKSIQNDIKVLINDASKIFGARNEYDNEDFLQKLLDDVKILEMTKKRFVFASEKIFEDDSEILYIPAGRSLLATLSEQLHDINITDIDLPMQEFISKIRNTKSKFGNKIPEIVSTYTKTVQGQIKNASLDTAYGLIQKILKADYVSDKDGEKLFFDKTHWVKLMFGSSGQQESLWILMLFFIIILEDKRVFVVLEEPEAHLYPIAQKHMIEIITLMINSTDSEMILTTHSPYVLTSLNLLMYSFTVESNKKIKGEVSIVPKNLRINPRLVNAYMIDKNQDFTIESILDQRNGLIKADKIDEISSLINEGTDKLIEMEINYGL